LAILPSNEKSLIQENQHIIDTLPFVIAIDSDQDGLPNDLEKRLGSNPDNPDSDNDGYTDSEEVKNGFNPRGRGKLSTPLAKIDQALINNKKIEQPKTDGKTDETVVKITNIIQPDSGSNKNLIIRGKSLPNQTVTVFIYSRIAILATVMTDDNGDWTYEFEDNLKDEEHEVYATIIDDQGRVVSKSAPKPFVIVQGSRLTSNKKTTNQIDDGKIIKNKKPNVLSMSELFKQTDQRLIIAIIATIALIITSLIFINRRQAKRRNRF